MIDDQVFRCCAANRGEMYRPPGVFPTNWLREETVQYWGLRE